MYNINNNIKDSNSSKNLKNSLKAEKSKISQNLYGDSFVKIKFFNYLHTDNKNEEFFRKYLETSLDDLEFDDAIVRDKRTFCLYFYDNFKEKQVIANTFCARDNLKTR